MPASTMISRTDAAITSAADMVGGTLRAILRAILLIVDSLREVGCRMITEPVDVRCPAGTTPRTSSSRRCCDVTQDPTCAVHNCALPRGPDKPNGVVIPVFSQFATGEELFRSGKSAGGNDETGRPG